MNDEPMNEHNRWLTLSVNRYPLIVNRYQWARDLSRGVLAEL